MGEIQIYIESYKIMSLPFHSPELGFTSVINQYLQFFKYSLKIYIYVCIYIHI